MSEQYHYQPDYLFSIVRTPMDWEPDGIFDVPPAGLLLSQEPVASFEEACEDLVRCNQLAMENGWNEWAIVQMDTANT